MANVQLPNINITPSDVDNANLPSLQKIVKNLLNTTAILTEELTFLLNNLDTRNVNEIDGDVLINGTVIAEKMLVEKLSAISADLGKITAGEVYGAYIATRENDFPRAEMSSDKNLFGAYTDELRKILIEAINVNSGSPRLLLESQDGSLSLYQQSSVSNIFTYNSELRVLADKDISFYPGQGYKVLVYFDQLRDLTTNQTLSSKLDSKAQSGVSTGLSGSHNHGFPDGTQFKDINGVTHTFRAAGSHSHSQT